MANTAAAPFPAGVTERTRAARVTLRSPDCGRFWRVLVYFCHYAFNCCHWNYPPDLCVYQ